MSAMPWLPTAADGALFGREGQLIIQGNSLEVLKTFPDNHFYCCVTSPPYYGLRKYGDSEHECGLEETPEQYVDKLVGVFREVRRVLRPDGTVWINIGDSYAANRGYQVPDGKWADVGNSKGMKAKQMGLKPKDLIGIPWRLAFALQADGWYLRQEIVWVKPNPMPESVTDRFTKCTESVFLLSKSARYWFDQEAVKAPVSSSSISRLQQRNLEHQAGSTRVPGKTNGNMKAVGNTSTRNSRNAWTITTQPFSGAHFAVMPSKLVEPCILAGCPDKCCPACGAGWVRVVEKESKSVERHEPGHGAHCPQSHHAGQTPHRIGGFEQKAVTTGWKPTCKCNRTDHVPGITIDPFAGAGTVGLVSAKHDRDHVGIELYQANVDMAHERIEREAAQGKLF